MATPSQDQGHPQSEQSWWPSARAVAGALKVWLVCLSSIAAVAIASLIISIIQFQGRLSSARAQNSAITLESIQIFSNYQNEIYVRYKRLGQLQDDLAKSLEKYSAHVASINARVVIACQNPLQKTTASATDDDCIRHFYTAINSRTTSLDSALPDLVKKSIEKAKLDEINVAVRGGLYEVQERVSQLQQQLQANCQVLMRYVGYRADQASEFAVPPALRMTVSVTCSFGVNSSPPAPLQEASHKTSEGDDLTLSGQDKISFRGVDRILVSELIFNYRFYDALSSRMRHLIVAPTEFISIVLVIVCGMLGSFLFHTYAIVFIKRDTRIPFSRADPFALDTGSDVRLGRLYII
jgi:hypothetical protein